MILNKTFKQLIKIKDLAYLNDLGCEVIEYYPNKQYLNGRVYVTGAYHSSKNNEVKLISEDLEFMFDLEKEDFYIDDIECISFDYNVLETEGIEFSYEIKLDVNIIEEFDLREDDSLNFEETLETIKEEIGNIVEEKLSDKLDVVDDNLPQNEEMFRSLNDDNKTIKIIYFNDEKELSKIAEQNNVSIDYLFKCNKNYNFNENKRVIIPYGK
ncbi:MAG: hypothetical protein J6K18_05520 [Bacilli bacterium]|nr:hypothetical protein [Bacilli bacterium]